MSAYWISYDVVLSRLKEIKFVLMYRHADKIKKIQLESDVAVQFGRKRFATILANYANIPETELMVYRRQLVMEAQLRLDLLRIKKASN